MWDLVPNEIKNFNLSRLSNSKAKDGFLKDSHAEYPKYILGKWVYSNIKKTGFEWDKIICYHYHHCKEVLYHFPLIYSSYVLL